MARLFWIPLFVGLLLVMLGAARPPANEDPAPSAPSVRVWGQTGHRVVGQVAQHFLTPEAAAGVAALLGDTSLAQVSTWADEIRSSPRWDFASRWHYITIDDTSAFVQLPPVPAAEGDVSNLIEAILYCERVLRDATAPRRRQAEALKFLVHFLGDLHQPLHVGRGPDRGGNNIQLFWFGEQTNLHSVWDSKIIDQQQLSFTEFASFINHASAADVAAWQGTGLLTWAQESMRLREGLYTLDNFPLDVDREGRFNLGYSYSYRHLPLVKQRLLQAGVRLAGLLNGVYQP